MKKMNITFDGNKFKKDGEDMNIDDVATDANKEVFPLGLMRVLIRVK